MSLSVILVDERGEDEVGRDPSIGGDGDFWVDGCCLKEPEVWIVVSDESLIALPTAVTMDWLLSLEARDMRLKLSGPSVSQVLIVAGSAQPKTWGSLSGKELPTAVAAWENALDWT